MAVEDAWYTIDKDTKGKVPTKRHGRGKRWRVRNRGAPTRSFHKKTDAENHDTAVKNDLLQGKAPFDHTKGRVLFKVYARKLIDERYPNVNSRKTNKSKLENHLVPFFGEKRICDIKPSTVTSWRLAMRDKPKQRAGPGEKLTPRTIASVDGLLVTIMLSAKRDKMIAENPCEDAVAVVPFVKRKIKVWEQKTVDKILDAVPERHYAVPLVSATCGHRQGESFAVAKGDIDFLRKRIAINHQVQRVDGQLVLVPPKGGKVRTVALPEVAGLALASHIKRHGTITVRCTCCGMDHEVLFHQEGKLLSQRDWNDDVWHPAVTAAGLTPSRTTGQHQLRHFYASTLIEGSADIEHVRDYMGHSSIFITSDVYGHLFERSHQKAINIVDQAFSARVYPMRTRQDQQPG